jgi:hypothetical protein
MPVIVHDYVGAKVCFLTQNEFAKPGSFVRVEWANPIPTTLAVFNSFQNVLKDIIDEMCMLFPVHHSSSPGSSQTSQSSIRFEAQIAKYGSSKDRQPSGTTLGLCLPVYLPFFMIGVVRE